MPNRPVNHTVRRWEIWLAVALVALFAGVLSWNSIEARSSADGATEAAQDATAAAKDGSAANRELAEILNRRAPTLEYLACRDRAELPFEAAQAEYLLAAVDLGEARRADPPAPAAELMAAAQRAEKARRAYEAAGKRLAAVTDPKAPLEADAAPGEPFRCPAIPLPGG